MRRGTNPSRSNASIPPKNHRPRSTKEPNQIGVNRTHELEPRRLEEEWQQRRERQEPSRECPKSVQFPSLRSLFIPLVSLASGMTHPPSVRAVVPHFLEFPTSRFMSIRGHEIRLFSVGWGLDLSPTERVERKPGAEGFCLLFYLEP